MLKIKIQINLVFALVEHTVYKVHKTCIRLTASVGTVCCNSKEGAALDRAGKNEADEWRVGEKLPSTGFLELTC